MPPKNDDDEIECDIIESFGVFSAGTKNWNKEINLISWNGQPAKIDIRNWQKDHKKCGKGIAVTREEAAALVKLLDRILKTEKEKSERPSKKKVLPPQTLEVFYDELELIFGAAPEECKSARNALLKKYHPDKNAANTAFATRKTIKIKEAYDKITAWWNNGLV